MKFSRFFAPTSKEAPKDAVLKSHILLCRAGYISQQSSGIYNYLPLGQITLQNIKSIINKHMQNAGCNYLNLSYATDANLWKKSGRYYKFGSELLRFHDRKQNEYVLAPTHEESIVDVVSNHLKSYKQLPINLYQITAKFRDEARPRFGLIRAKEFIMKDAYSFHASTDCLEREFSKMERVYRDIFDELGLSYRVVEADSGAIGGSGSKEFMVLSDAGEDDILLCSSCQYAANIEAARRQARTTTSPAPQASPSRFKTPGVKTIDELCEFFKVDSFYTIKAVVYKAVYEDSSKAVVFFVRGCDDIELAKAKSACGALELEPAEPSEYNLASGYIGPIGLSGVEFFIDSELNGASDMICGANETDYHLVGVKMVNFESHRFVDLVRACPGDLCPCCGAPMQLQKGIEVGHIFKLGTRYSQAMNATYLDENGKAKPYIMGCYGIGVSRLLAVLAQTSSDESGLIFAPNVAPFVCSIIIQDIKSQEQNDYANKLYNLLSTNEILANRVLLDDRAERIGSKLKDYELIGIPYAIIVGKNYSEGKIELIKRQSGDKCLLDASQTSAILDALGVSSSSDFCSPGARSETNSSGTRSLDAGSSAADTLGRCKD